MTWLVVGVFGETETYPTQEAAISAAEDAISWYRDQDYWDEEEVSRIVVAEVTHSTVKEVLAVRNDMPPDEWEDLTAGSDSDEWWEFSLTPTGTKERAA